MACGVLAGGFVYTQFVLKAEENIISKTNAGELALAYINEVLLGGQIEASLVGDIEEKGLYKFQIEVDGEEFISYITNDGKILFPQGIDLEEEKAKTEAEEKDTTLGNFSVSEDEICLENEKPIVYFFGSQTCGYCQWEHPVVEAVTSKFSNYISFHNNMDSDEDMDVFSKYSTGGIPTLVLGCKYYRVGAGTQLGEEEEAKVLTALICDLTGEEPADVCNQ